jgi:hypothetical protein
MSSSARRSEPDARRFSVHAMSEGRHRSEIVYGSGHEDAAIGFVEHHTPPLDADDHVSVIVHDCESGQEHCYRIDLGTGEAAPCD